MELKNNNYSLSKSKTNTFVANVFSLMFTALIISGIAAFWFATDSMRTFIIDIEGSLTTLGWISMIAPIGLVLLMGFGFQKYSAQFLLGIFLLYSTLTGISLSTIFPFILQVLLQLHFLLAQLHLE